MVVYQNWDRFIIYLLTTSNKYKNFRETKKYKIKYKKSINHKTIVTKQTKKNNQLGRSKLVARYYMYGIYFKRLESGIYGWNLMKKKWLADVKDAKE